MIVRVSFVLLSERIIDNCFSPWFIAKIKVSLSLSWTL